MEAANFSASSTQAPDLPSYVTPKEGVGKPNPLEAVGKLFDIAGVMLEERSANKKQSAINEFTKKQLLIADALDQGAPGMTSAYARTMFRKNLLDAIDSNPNIDASEFIKAQSSILGIAGGAQIVDEGTKQEQYTNMVREGLVKAGLVSPTATDAEFSKAEENFRVAAAAEERHTERMRTIDEQLKNNQLSREDRDRLKQDQADANIAFLRDSSPAYYQKMYNDFSNIIQDATISESEKVQIIEDMYTGFTNQAADKLGSMSTQESSAFLKPFTEMKDNFLKRATGELSDAEMERKNKRLIAAQKNLFLIDPDIARIAAAQDIVDFGSLGDIVLGKSQIFDKYMNIIAGNTGEATTMPVFSSDDNTNKANVEVVKTYIQALDSDNPERAARAAELLKTQLGNIELFDKILANDPKSGKSMADYFASAEFLAARTSHPEVFTDLEGAIESMQRYYGDEVWGLIDREFRKNKVSVLVPNPNAGEPGPAQARNVREFVGVDSIVTTRSTPSGMEFVAIDPNDKDGIARARQLNNDLKPIINSTVRAFSHLNGKSDYKAAWESVSEQFMSGEVKDTTPENDLSVDDFLKKSAVDEALTTGGYVGDGDYTNAETPEDVAASFIGFTETEHEEVLSKFIENTFGKKISPADTAWCAAFVNSALGAKGMEGTGKLNARSFMEWGEPVTDPKKGDIVVFERGNSSWQGHVGFYVGPSDRKGYVKVLGGNQNDKVSIKDFPVAKLLGYRRASS